MNKPSAKQLRVLLMLAISVCCLASSELHELFTLTDQTSNDFVTVRAPQVARLAAPVVCVEARVARLFIESPSELAFLVSDAIPREPNSDLLRLYSIQRT